MTPTGPLRWIDVLTQWRVDPVTLAVLLAALVMYLRYRTLGRRAGIVWPAHRDAVFAIGMVCGLWVSCGTPQARSGQLEWVWMGQLLVLLLLVPPILLAAQPLQLARRVSGERAAPARVLASRPARVLGHPLIGPVLVPVLFLLLLFGGVGQAAAAHPAIGWLVHAGFLLVGLLIAVPLVDTADSRTSLAVALALAIGAIELLIDAFPGIVLRLAEHPVIPYFAAHTPGWAGGWLYQQNQAGGLLWIVAEVLDLPFMILMAVRWLRLDAAEAARIDAELDAAQAIEAPTAPGTAAGRTAPPATSGGPVLQRPWFLDDPQLRERYRY